MRSPESGFRAFERAGWERAAAAYGGAFGSLTGQAIGPLLDAAGAGRGMRLLDVASGPGFAAAEAARRGALATGADFSAAMVALARRLHPGIDFREGDAESLPFPDAAFDGVAMNFGLLHLGEPERAVGEAQRVLRPGGRFAFTVWAAPPETAGFEIVLRAVEAHGRTDVGLPPGPPFFRFSDPAECRAALSAAGFDPASISHARIPMTWRLAGPAALLDAFLDGAVRTAGLLRAQAPEALFRIRRAIEDGAARYRSGDAIELPMPAVLASGRKR